jgi:hypothetical protein
MERKTNYNDKNLVDEYQERDKQLMQDRLIVREHRKWNHYRYNINSVEAKHGSTDNKGK